jgi:hypothetical protein
MPLTPAERVLRAQIASNTRWAVEDNRPAATQAARNAFLDRFEKQVDPDGTLVPAERARRAKSARTAYFQRLSLKSAQARRRRSGGRQAAVQERLAELDGGGDHAA